MFAFEGFIVGFFGGMHCIGMCGPIALALPLSQQNKGRKILGGILYNLGRALTYALLGLIFGLVGTGLKMTGIQQWVSIACGALMILSVSVPFIFNIKYINYNPRIFKNIGIREKMATLLRKQKQHTMLFIGILNGFLPCGLVYIALSGALVSESLTGSVLFMFLFGLGTLPYLFLLIYFGNVIKGRLFNQLRKFIPVFIVLLGLLFILRGLNLGIKYISPKFSVETNEVESCCH